MKLIYVKKTASQQEQNEIVESLNAGREPSANVHSVEIMTMHQSDTVPDADGDYALLGLLNETDPKRKSSCFTVANYFPRAVHMPFALLTQAESQTKEPSQI